jgi:hypothetical protein
VIVDIREYKEIQESIEVLESIRAYDCAKASGDDLVPLEQAIREITKKR